MKTLAELSREAAEKVVYSHEFQDVSTVERIITQIFTDYRAANCAKCGKDHAAIMQRALTSIFDYCGTDIQAIKNTAYRAIPSTECQPNYRADKASGEVGKEIK